MSLPATERLADALLGAPDQAQPALISGGRTISYGELVDLVDRRCGELQLNDRSLVLLTGSRSLEWVVSYLALLRSGHVPLLGGDRSDELRSTWTPDAWIHAWDSFTIDRSPAPNRELHPDLALLLSTSGSTGSAKLVRLSQQNLVANARAIATSLQLGEHDRGITSLPFHYCYGLSVLHAHLVVGASVVVSEASVVDPCFAKAIDQSQVTNLSGVPHTFDLLEQVGPGLLAVPSLRLLTCAGGRLPADAVRRWVDRADGWGAELVLMYGQTEATARMAYLPADLAATRANAIGIPIPGGTLRVNPLPDQPEGFGELVYTGPNVMMGYATVTSDLAVGATVDELRTGDLGRQGDDGIFEILGRRARFTKPFGVRIDLDRVQDLVTSSFGEAVVSGDDQLLVALVQGGAADKITTAICGWTGLPDPSIEVVTTRAVPRTPSAKVDYQAVLRYGQAQRAEALAAVPSGGVADIYRLLLAPDRVDGSTTFVSAGGDSLNYVECSAQLEMLLGTLPPDWHLQTVDDLESRAPTAKRNSIDTTVALRALGICTVVATHMRLRFLPGGAHLLLAIVGFNLSRFQLGLEGSVPRLRAAARTIARTALPTMAWVAVGMVIFGGYGLPTLLLVNNYVGPPDHVNGRWHFWFIEAFVQIYLVVALLLAIPAVRRLERRAPYGFPLVLLGLTLALVPDWHGLSDVGNLRFRTHGVAWFFALGWLVHRSDRTWQKVVTAGVCLMTVPGFFGQPEREAYIAVGLIVLTFARTIPFPRLLIRPVSRLSAAGLWILISHFRLWPVAAELLPLPVAYAATLAAGVGIWMLVEAAGRTWRLWRSPADQRRLDQPKLA